MIIKAPNPKLNIISHDCKWPEAKTIQKLLLTEIDKASVEGQECGFSVVGLAAPQIGIAKRVFTAFGKVFINPEIMWRSKEMINSREGCLSLEGVTERKRHKSVNLRWLNIGRGAHTQYFHDSAAVIIQHEMDHLNGILCND